MYLSVSDDFRIHDKDRAVESDMLGFLYKVCREKYELNDNSEVRKLWDVLKLDLTDIIKESDGGINVE